MIHLRVFSFFVKNLHINFELCCLWFPWFSKIGNLIFQDFLHFAAFSLVYFSGVQLHLWKMLVLNQGAHIFSGNHYRGHVYDKMRDASNFHENSCTHGKVMQNFPFSTKKPKIWNIWNTETSNTSNSSRCIRLPNFFLENIAMWKSVLKSLCVSNFKVIAFLSEGRWKFHTQITCKIESNLWFGRNFVGVSR